MITPRLSSRLNSRRRADPGRRWARVAMAVLATIGAIDTGAITLKRWGLMGSLTCPGGAEGCDKVLNSAWGSLFGYPLSLFGFLAYGVVLVMAVVPLALPMEARTEMGQRSWWGLLLVSTGMAVFSLMLMGVMVFKIEAFCAFCVLSALLSLSLLVLALVGGDWLDRGALLFRILIVGVLVMLTSLVWAGSVDRPIAAARRGDPPPVKSVSTPETIALAEHLSATGARMYSAYWCPHCHDQKEMFGAEASKKLDVVECAADGTNSRKDFCDTKAIEGFPTWEINGTLDSGVKPLAKLAELSGFRPGAGS